MIIFSLQIHRLDNLGMAGISHSCPSPVGDVVDVASPGLGDVGQGAVHPAGVPVHHREADQFLD